MCGGFVHLCWRAHAPRPAPLALFRRPLSAEETVTLTFKSKGGNPFPMTFTPKRFEAFVSKGRTVMQMTKDGSRKRGIVTLEEAKSVAPPDYLLLSTPFDTVADLESFTRNHGSGLEQQTNRSIANNPALCDTYGALTALADGEPITFYAADNKPLLEADGLVKNSVCLLFNEAKHSPSPDDVKALEARAEFMRTLLANPGNVMRTYPPGMMEQLVGVKEVVPVLSGFRFAPKLMELCRQRGIVPMTTDGNGFSIKE